MRGVTGDIRRIMCAQSDREPAAGQKVNNLELTSRFPLTQKFWHDRMKPILSFISDRYTNLKASAYFSVLARDPTVWLSILTGVFAFVGVTGGRILRPEYIDWLME